MKVVIPYSYKDFMVAWRMAELLCLKTEVIGEDIFLYQSKTVPQDPPKELLDKYRIRLIRCKSDTANYPEGPNIMFSALARNMLDGGFADRIFLAEPDGFPTCTDWYTRVKIAHEVSGKQCSGSWVGWTTHPEWDNGCAHFNGNMVIDRTLFQRHPVLARTVSGPWDVHHGELLAAEGAINCQIINPRRNQAYYNTDWWFSNRHAWVHGCQGFQCWDRIERWPDFRNEGKPNIYTFFHQSQNVTSYQPIIDLWRDRWSRAGFNPVVLGPEIAQQHPRYAELVERINKLPTINDPTYEALCYIRWLALEVVGGGVMADSDVLPNGIMPDDLKHATDVCVFDKEGVPCLVGATKEGAAKIIDTLFEEPTIRSFGDRKHTSDMEFFMKYIHDRKDICRPVGSEDQTTKCVHFSQYACRSVFGKDKSMEFDKIVQYDLKYS